MCDKLSKFGLGFQNRMPSANCRKKLVHRQFQWGDRQNGGANCRVCAEKVILPKLQKGCVAGSVPFLIMGALLGKKKRKVKSKRKKSKKVNLPRLYCSKSKKHVFWTQEKREREQSERERDV